MSESPEELRAEIDDVRAELGATIEELTRRMDVPARVRASGTATVERVREGAERATALASAQVATARQGVSRYPAFAAAAGAVAVLIVGVLLRRRAGRR
jgi:ElaB/YqjD/DUF883 family membrane-anchored ribosome-binding protein